MPSKDDIVVAFDFYGTLVSPDSVIDQLSDEFGAAKAPEISSLWRRYQLEYTWRLNSMSQTEGFRAVTKQSLIHALLELNVPTRNTSIDSCMSCYDNLTPFSDVVPLIAELEKTSNLVPVIFSNAEREMIDLKTLNEQSQGFGIFRDVVCVDATPYFKPHPETYHHLAECMSREKSINGISKMWLVSANPFDIVGGMNVGMKTVWIDRKGGGWKDQLVSGDRGMPSKVVRGLEEVVHAIQKYTGVSQE